MKKVIAVVSGKGGVGKSTVTSMLAMAMHKLGYKTAILDADITGPSIPKAFGLHEQIVGSDDGMLPAITPEGIRSCPSTCCCPMRRTPSSGAPVIGGAVSAVLDRRVLGARVDYMFVDLPPGTGDVMLTVFQSLPIDGVVIVTSPQSLVSMIVSGRQHGADDEHPGLRLCGELQLLPVPGLRQTRGDLRQEQATSWHCSSPCPSSPACRSTRLSPPALTPAGWPRSTPTPSCPPPELMAKA